MKTYLQEMKAYFDFTDSQLELWSKCIKRQTMPLEFEIFLRERCRTIGYSLDIWLESAAEYAKFTLPGKENENEN